MEKYVKKVSPIIFLVIFIVPSTSILMEIPWKPMTPLALKPRLHDISTDASYWVPKFSGIRPLKIDEHMQNFYDA